MLLLTSTLVTWFAVILVLVLGSLPGLMVSGVSVVFSVLAGPVALVVPSTVCGARRRLEATRLMSRGEGRPGLVLTIVSGTLLS